MTIATLFSNSTWGTAAEGAVVSNQLIQKGFIEKSKLAEDNQKPWAARKAGAPDFVMEATTTASETGAVEDLTTDKGFVPKAGYLYPVKLRYFAQDAEDRWTFERDYVILGGTTPVITGGKTISNAIGLIAGAAVDYGSTRTSYPIVDGAIGTILANSSAGTSLADVDSGNGVITHPIARATLGVRCVSAHFAADVETIGERRHVQVASQATSTTSTLSISTINGTEAVGVPTDDGELTFELYIEPPPNGFLTMNGNNVEAHVSMDASDNVRHRLEVFVGEPIAAPFIT